MSPVTSPLHNRIAAFTDHPTCLKGLEARIGEAHLRVDADSEEFLLPGDAVFQSPVARSVRVHEQEQPAAVVQLVRLGTRLRLSDLGVGQTVAGHALAGSERRGLVPRSFSSVPRELPPKPLDGNAPGRTRLDADFAKPLVWLRFSDQAGHCWSSIWRRERDSNPRYGCPYTHFPGVRLQPLGHPSVGAYGAVA